MASGPITSWQIGEIRRVQGDMAIDFMADRKRKSGGNDILFSWAPKITSDSNCRHEIKRCLLFRRKAMTHLDSILKKKRETILC